MSAHHFFVEPAAIGEDAVTVSGDEAHHAIRVLRVRIGEPITVADGSGRMIDAVVSAIDDRVRADIKAETFVQSPVPSLTLYQALTKGEKLDLVIEKATEIGVRRIVPFAAERSIVRWDRPKQARAHDRWAAVAKAAAKQSRSPWIPTVDDVATDPDAALETTAFVLHETAQKRMRDALPSEAPTDASIIVGPEGGFSDDEIARLADGGAHVVSLGPRILRTETAGLVAASIVAYTYGWVG